MTDHATDATAETEQRDRYAFLEIGEDDVVIYDREEPRAWLQSDVAVDPAT
jgi:hypothetical protein